MSKSASITITIIAACGAALLVTAFIMRPKSPRKLPPRSVPNTAPSPPSQLVEPRSPRDPDGSITARHDQIAQPGDTPLATKALPVKAPVVGKKPSGATTPQTKHKPAPARSLLDWEPPDKAPAFRFAWEDDASFQKAVAKELANINVDALLRTQRPSRNIRVRYLGDPQNSELQLNDLVSKINGKPVWDPIRAHTLAGDEPARFTVYRDDDHSFEIESVFLDLDASFIPGLDLRLEYLRATDGKEPYRDRMLVAAAAARRRPEMAERCLHETARDGRKADYFTYVLGALVAWSKGRMDEAMAFAHFARKKSPGDLVASTVFLHAAMCNYKFPAALDVVRSVPLLHGKREADLLAAIKADRALPAALRVATSPAEWAARYRHESTRRKWTGVSKAAAGWVRSGLKPVRVTPRAGRFVSFVLGPAIENGELRARFVAHPTDNKKTPWSKTVGFGFIREDYGAIEDFANGGRIHADISLSLDAQGSEVWVNFHNPAFTRRTWDPVVRLAGNATHELRIIVVGGRVSIHLDKRRLLYAPWPNRKVKLLPYFKTVGMVLWLPKFDVREFKELRPDTEDVF